MNANIWNYGNTFDATISNREIDENGRLRVRRSLITKESVDKYYGSEIPDFESFGLSPEKVYNVYRPAGELEKALAKFKMLPLLDKHLMDFSDIPQRDNWVGVLGDCEIENGAVFGELSVWDKEAIKDIESEIKRDLSLGYCAKYELVSGNFNGVHYDLRMKDIVPNHLALVENGRVKGAAVFDEENEGNPTHDKKTGQFTSKNGSSGGEGQEQNKGKQKASKDRPIQIKGDELGKYKDINELRKKAIDYYRNHLQGKKIKNDGLEGEVMFSGKGRDEFKNTSPGENKLKMIVALKDIVENGNYMSSEDLSKERKDGVIKFHRINHFIEMKIKIPNSNDYESKVYEVSALISEDKFGNKFYNLNDDVEDWRKKTQKK